MKEFKDLEHKDHSTGLGGTMSRMEFDNGYGVSVVRTPHTYGGDKGLFELAVLDGEGRLCYDTPITDGVMGYLTEESVTGIMVDVQALPKREIKC